MKGTIRVGSALAGTRAGVSRGRKKPGMAKVASIKIGSKAGLGRSGFGRIRGGMGTGATNIGSFSG